ncbi:MAG: hypothetical protein Q4Q58_04260, partial [Thermoplasmata archaeon]|nr:hypothetical protein [Thermoplasmata archaeon]
MAYESSTESSLPSTLYGGVYTLESDVTLGYSDSTITVPASASVYLDLNGYTLESISEYIIIDVYGSLTIMDSGSGGRMEVLGKYNARCVHVEEGGS